MFPSQILGQLLDMIDRGLLFGLEEPPDSKWQKILSVIKKSYAEFPRTQKSLSFTIVYCTRESYGMQSTFRVFTLKEEPELNCSGEQEIELPENSGIISTFGSGRSFVEKWHSFWNNTPQKRTSRSVFSAFCDALYSGEDNRSGGAPQLVGLYRQGPAKSFGVIYQGQRYFLGLPVDESLDLQSIEWRNALFERCDGLTLERKNGAQPHHKPRGLGKAK